MKLATNGSAGAAISSAGVPIWSSLPSTRTPMRPGERRGVLVVVRHEQRRQVEASSSSRGSPRTVARVRVERGQRLVGQQHGGIAGEGTREADALALAARRLGLPARGGDPETLEVVDALARRSGRSAPPSCAGRARSPGTRSRRGGARAGGRPPRRRTAPCRRARSARARAVRPGSRAAPSSCRPRTAPRAPPSRGRPRGRRLRGRHDGERRLRVGALPQGRSLTRRSTQALMTMSSALMASAVSKSTSSSA